MAASDVVWVDVLPSMRSFGAQLSKEAAGAGTRTGKQVADELSDAATQAGKQAGRNLGQGMASAVPQVRKLADQVEAARNREADAAGKVRVAEQRLAEVRSNARSTGSQLAATEERLATAHRGLETAQQRVTTQTARYEQAQKQAASGTDELTSATRTADTETTGFGASLGELGKKAGVFAAGVLAIGGAATSAAAALERGQLADKLAAQLGATPQMSADLGRIAGSLYSQAYGESLAQVNEAIRGVIQSGLVMEDASSAQIEAVTGKVLNLASAFGQDLAGTTQAVGQLMKTGLAPNAQVALDVLTRGFQQGADRSGDLLDTMTEYSTQFQKFGLDAQMATGLLVQGMKAGARNSDLVADAIKEFSIRAVDGSTLTAEGFSAIGLNAEVMAAKIAQGGPVARAALDVVLDRLRGMKDPVAQSRAAVALFGTQAEDLGRSLFALDPSAAVGALGQVGGAAEKMGTTLRDNAATRITEFQRTVQSGLVTFFGGTVIPVLESAFGWIRDNSGWLVPLTLGLGTFFGLFVGVPAIIGGVTAAIAALRTGVIAMNLAVAANPIGFIVAALIALGVALVYAWNHSETFRAIVTGALHGVTVAAIAVGGWFTWLWRSIILPAFTGIAAAATWAWNVVLKPTFDAISFALRFVAAVLFVALVAPWLIAWNVLSAAALAAWNTVLAPTFHAIGAVAMWLWNWALKPVFGWIAFGWRVLAVGIQAYWATVLKPAWDAVAAAATWLWNWALKPAFDGIGRGWRGLITGMKWAWDWILKPAWDGLSAAALWLWAWALRPTFAAIGAGWDALLRGMKWVWDWILRPAFDGIKIAVAAVGDAFQRTVDWIARAWNTVRDAVAAPIRWVIDVVVNRGVLAAWNWIDEKLGLGLHVNPVPLAFAQGGPVTGGRRGRDSVPAMLMPDEYVLSAPAVRNLGGTQAVEAMHRDARTGGPTTDQQGAGPPGGGGGGRIGWQHLWDIIRGPFPGAIKTSDYRPGDSGLHGTGQAIDLAGPMLAMNRWIAANYPQSAQLIHTPGINLLGGTPHRYNAATQADHYDHVHWALTGATGTGNGQAGNGGGGGWWSRLVSWALGHVRGWMNSAIDDITATFGDNWYSKFAAGPPRKAADLLLDKIQAMVGAGGGASMAPGSGPVVDQVRGVATRFGWGSGPQWDALSWLLAHESSWNPNAQNPTSTAYGLFQFLDSTWATVGAQKTSNPAQQAQAGLQYIRQRYDDPLGARRFWESHNWYDRGGLLPTGPSLVMNNTGKPERVFTDDQWNTLQRSSGESRADITVHAKTDASPQHIAHTIDRHIAMSARL